MGICEVREWGEFVRGDSHIYYGFQEMNGGRISHRSSRGVDIMYTCVVCNPLCCTYLMNNMNN